MASRLSSESAWNAVMKCWNELTVFVRNNLEDIAVFLSQSRIIDRKKFNEISDIKSMLSTDEKAERLVRCLQQKVEEDDRHFRVFMQHLKEKYSDACIIKELESAFSDLSRQAEYKFQSMKMIKNFNHINEKFLRHLESGSIDLSRLKLILKNNIKLTPIYKDDNNEELTSKKLESKSTVAEIMGVFASFCNFFNYELLEEAMKAVNYEEGILLMENYKEDFKAYAKDRIVKEFDGQPELNLPPNNHSSVLTLILDDTYKGCKLEYLVLLLKNISDILGVKVVCAGRIMSGSISVRFYIFGASGKKVFPLNKLQVDAVRKLQYMGAKVIQISCNGVVYYPEIQLPSFTKILLTVNNMKDVLHKAQFKPEDAPMFGEQLGLESDEIQYIQRKFKGDAVKIQDSILRAWHRSGLKKERITWEVFVHSLVNCSYSCDVELISGSIPDISHHDKLKGAIRQSGSMYDPEDKDDIENSKVLKDKPVKSVNQDTHWSTVSLWTAAILLPLLLIFIYLFTVL